jgi:RNA polymerase sigma-32 factor
VPAGSQPLALGFPVNLGNIEAYISAVNHLPLLTQEEELSLARRLRNENDLAAAQAHFLGGIRE